MAAEDAQTTMQKLDTDDPVLLSASSSTDHEDDLQQRRNSQRWAGGDNLSATKMSLMLSHMKVWGLFALIIISKYHN